MKGPVSPADLLAALPLALLVVDESGTVRDANGEAQAVLNRSASALLDRPLSELLHIPEASAEDAGQAFAAFDVDFQAARGRRMRGDIHVTPMPDPAGWHIVTIANARDHSLGSGLERRGSSRTAIAIAATLAHEIKNPLSGIRGAAQLLEGVVPAEDAKLTRLIRTEVDRITALIDRMEGFTDTRPIDLSAHNIHAIVDHARIVVEQGFGDRLEVTEQYDPSLPDVLTHQDSLIQVVINLLKNAAETAVDGERRQVVLTTRYRHGVTLSSATRPDQRRPLPIELCVIDDGPGAPPELVDQLFDPFISGKRGGQGLGLALTDKLVRDMGGLIQYSREGAPPQTVFRLLLQRAGEQRQ